MLLCPALLWLLPPLGRLPPPLLWLLPRLLGIDPCPALLRLPCQPLKAGGAAREVLCRGTLNCGAEKLFTEPDGLLRLRGGPEIDGGMLRLRGAPLIDGPVPRLRAVPELDGGASDRPWNGAS